MGLAAHKIGLAEALGASGYFRRVVTESSNISPANRFLGKSFEAMPSQTVEHLDLMRFDAKQPASTAKDHRRPCAADGLVKRVDFGRGKRNPIGTMIGLADLDLNTCVNSKRLHRHSPPWLMTAQASPTRATQLVNRYDEIP